jgi:hypothetical protein
MIIVLAGINAEAVAPESMQVVVCGSPGLASGECGKKAYRQAGTGADE